MAEFPLKLDDGELWLPSDIFPDEVPSKFGPHFSSHLTCMEDLAQRFAAYSLLQPTQTSAKLPPNLERFEPPVMYDSVGPTPTRCFRVHEGDRVYGYGTGYVCAGPRPFYNYHFLKPVQPQVESFVETRARVLQRQQNRFLQNRVFPFQGSGVGLGGFARESGGTGVFLPRVAAAAAAAATTTTTSTTSTSDARKRYSVRNRQETQVTQQRNFIRRVGTVGKQEECHCQLPPDMGLPQDWTY